MVQNISNYTLHKNTTWAVAWQDVAFRTKIIAGCLVFAILVAVLPSFFALIEKREGVVLHDLILHYIPARNFSLLIFVIIWSSSVLVLIRSIQQPVFFLTVLLSLILVLIARMLTIYFVVLDPPEGLIKLTDPITSLTYGGRNVFITKDLFFSGHTSNLFLFYLCLTKKKDKIFLLLGSISVAILVLVQHVHYSMDVVAAFVITFFLVHLVKKYLVSSPHIKIATHNGGYLINMNPKKNIT